MIIKTLVNIGVDNRELFRFQLGATLLKSIVSLLQKSLPIHHQHFFTQDGLVVIGESLLDKSTELCLRILILVVEGSEQFRLDHEFIALAVPLLRHKSTSIVLLVLRTLRTLTSDSHFAGTMRQNIQVAQIDGNTRPIPMIQLVAELFGAYFSRLRTQIGQIQLLWTTEPDNAMLLDGDTSIGGTYASEPLDVVTLTSQISATCEVLRGIDDQQTETTLMKIATRVLSVGERRDSKSYQPRMIDRDSAHRLCSLLTQSQFVETMENHSQKRTQNWTKELGKLRSRCSEYEKTYSEWSSPSSPFSIDCVPFLSWPGNQEGSWFGQTVVFQSLVAALKLQPALDVSLEAKAAKFLESMNTPYEELVDDPLSTHLLFSDGSFTDFVKSILVLLSSPNQVIKTATVKMLKTVVLMCSAPLRLVLIKADLIGQLVVTLNPFSVSLPDSEHLHSKFLSIIHLSVLLATPRSLKELKKEDPDEQQSVRETVLKQVLAPSEKYFSHLCVNRFSIVEGDMSTSFMTLLSQLLQISSHCQQTKEFVLTLPVFLATSSCLSFFETDSSIYSFLSYLVDTQQKWKKQDRDVHQSEATILRSLRMEGIDDVIEEKLVNDRSSYYANCLVVNSLEWSNMLGMNFSEHA
ncbi:hypothetical protein BLNAU_15288 [Blattamonas nauphoetae]|uniref:Uncharacterized protein n=1 Tax=Blattamonas nauphoetae TaxID=2049346 RepID=A0ABQ9XBA3_9EUKA|nr:hypothetical protein BLNAU_15288 [Blattamonas nauphoetae]